MYLRRSVDRLQGLDLILVASCDFNTPANDALADSAVDNGLASVNDLRRHVEKGQTAVS